MAKSIDKKRKPASKKSNFVCAAMIGYGRNMTKGEFGLEDVNHGKKSAPLSSELIVGMEITAANGGNPNRQEMR